MSRVRILAIEVDKVTMDGALERCREFLHSQSPHLIVTPNAEIAYLAANDPSLAALINGADLVIPDGAGVVLAARILGDPLPEKVAGADLATKLLAELEKEQASIYLLGAKPAVVREAARRIHVEHRGLKAVYYQDGYFQPESEAGILADIREKRPQALFVGMGAPRQEEWLAAHLEELDVPICMGVGGTIDLWAGTAKRAPHWLIRTNLEWLFRVVRFGRYGRSLPPLVKFTLAVIARRLRGR